MKINKLMFALLAGAMFASCSDDLGNEPTPGEGPTTSGYMSVAISLPTNLNSRANDVFDDGLESEYDVKSCAVLFFEGREEDATFVGAYNLSYADKESENDNPNQITSVIKSTFKVDVTNTPNSLWALAVLNYGALMTVENDRSVKFLTGTNAENFTVPTEGNSSTKTIKDFLKATTTASLATSANGFFMTNTPYVASPGGATQPSGFVHILASVDKEKNAQNEADAKANPAAEIFVERAVAKVTVSTTVALNAISPDLPKKISSIEWIIDNTEPSSYIARNIGNFGQTDFNATKAPTWMTYTRDNNNYRFAGAYPLAPGKDMYRVYFGIDPNDVGVGDANGEEEVSVESDFIVLDSNAAGTIFKSIGSDNPQYCKENTFDVAHMNWFNTTRAVLKVTFEGGDFFTRGQDRTTMYTPTDAFTTLGHFVLENSDVVNAFTEYFKGQESRADITLTNLSIVNNGTTRTASNAFLELTFRISNNEEDEEIVDGNLIVSSIKLYNGKTGTDKEVVPFIARDGLTANEVAKAAATSVNKQVTFNAYVGGVSYYAVRIKHFGDDLTPWSAPKDDTTGKEIATVTTLDSYGTDSNAAANYYLGRYGVLRNNWYDLAISEIGKFGEPLPGRLVLDYTPDDINEPDQAIACRINILSWAKRNQNVIL